MADRGRKGGPKPPTRTCFIGNLPWDIAEPQLRELFAEVGPIKTFRVVTDRETGRPKGFGFCEYFDIPTAASAQRNLNGHEINGRKIHVDFAEDKERGDPSRGPRGGPLRHQGVMGMDSATRAAGAVVTLVDGGPPTTGGPPDGVTSALAGMSKAQLYEILAQMKGLIQQNPGQARQILVTSPQLAKALFQAQVMLGMVPQPASAAEAAAANGGPPAQQQPQYDPPYETQPPAGGGYQQGGGPGPFDQQAPPPQQAYGSAPMQTDHGYGGGDGYGGTPQYDSSAPDYVPPAGYGPPNPAPYAQPAYGAGGGPQQGTYAADPRQHAAAADPRAQQHPTQQQQQPYSPPPAAPVEQQAPPTQQPAAQQPQIDGEQQKALLAQIMGLTADQIALLPEAQKQQVIALQRQMGGGA